MKIEIPAMDVIAKRVYKTMAQRIVAIAAITSAISMVVDHPQIVMSDGLDAGSLAETTTVVSMTTTIPTTVTTKATSKSTTHTTTETTTTTEPETTTETSEETTIKIETTLASELSEIGIECSEAVEPVIIEEVIPENPVIVTEVQTEPAVFPETTPATETEPVATSSEVVYSSGLKSIPLSDDLNQYIYDQAAAHGLPYEWVLATIRQESNFNAKAVSSAGCIGLMQISRRYNKDINLYDPYQNVKRGCEIMERCWKKAGGNMGMAYTYYNLGEYTSRRTPVALANKVINYYNQYCNQ